MAGAAGVHAAGVHVGGSRSREWRILIEAGPECSWSRARAACNGAAFGERATPPHRGAHTSLHGVCQPPLQHPTAPTPQQLHARQTLGSALPHMSAHTSATSACWFRSLLNGARSVLLPNEGLCGGIPNNFEVLERTEDGDSVVAEGSSLNGQKECKASSADEGDEGDSAAAPAPATEEDEDAAVAPAPQEEEEEEVYYEGSGAPGELIISLLLGTTLLYLVRPRCTSLPVATRFVASFAQVCLWLHAGEIALGCCVPMHPP